MIAVQRGHMGGIFLYNQPEAILEQYDLNIRQITKGRGTYICDSSQGMKLLVPFRGSAERALFLRSVLENLKARGFAVEQICLTKEGAAVAEDENGTRYWLKDFTPGNECSPGRPQDMTGAVTSLAGLHRALDACTKKLPEFMQSEAGESQNRCKRHYRELVRMKNYVQARKSKNEFDRCFQKAYPHFILQAERAVELFEQLDDQMQGQKLCHGDFNQHNVLRTPEGLRIVNFEGMCSQPQVWDLCNFIRKMMEKNNWDTTLGMLLLETYEKKRSLAGWEKKLMYSLLLFPEKFWKITNHYGNSHKAWVSQRDIEKLKRLTEAEHAREQFLENLFSFL